MDDGQEVKRGGVTLCTDSYTSDEVILLKNALENKFKISTTIHNKRLDSTLSTKGTRST
jgi:hypothetical protein